ncbi:MAG: serine hydrolase, partial [Bacteroidales bacterium]|nr:serine hydrolase [Bacteroidales bacterium]
TLVDENGYFFPMMGPNPAYPGQSVMENASKFDIKEIEKEFRAQIELVLKNIPQVTHISGHMFSTAFSPEVIAVVQKLSDEYNLPSIDRAESFDQYGFTYTGYEGPKATFEEKVASFIKSLDKMEKDKRYMFVDHPAYNDSEMQTVMHVGYEDVAVDRQGVTDLLKSPEVLKAIEERGIKLIDINTLTKSLPRAETPAKMVKATERYLAAAEKAEQDLHSIMIVKDGNVIYENWMSSGSADEPHILNSVSKTFTSMAVGLAVSEGKLSIDEKLVDIFPEHCPENPSEFLKEITVEHLLTMTCGHSSDPTYKSWEVKDRSWIRFFMEHPITHKPGTLFCYNSLGTYILSAIVQKRTEQKVVDYLFPRLFRPLGINNVSWTESHEGINTGGWGLFLKTEDLAKMGLMILQNGQFNGKQIVPAEWIEAASAAQVPCVPAGLNSDDAAKLAEFAKESDWLQGYGYQMWRSRYNSFRADGANGQYILVIPEKNAVVVTTAHIQDMQAELNLIW